MESVVGHPGQIIVKILLIFFTHTILCFRLLMSQMEQVLDQHLEDEYKHLGLPYWDWSSDQSKIYQHEHNGEELIVPLFPDFWQEVKVGYKNPNHGSYKDAFEDKGAGWGDHCTSDRYLDKC